MEEQALQKFALDDVWAAVISNLDGCSKSFEVNGAVCLDSKSQFYLVHSSA